MANGQAGATGALVANRGVVASQAARSGCLLTGLPTSEPGAKCTPIDCLTIIVTEPIELLPGSADQATQRTTPQEKA
jgi:hypothetical protein